MWCLKQLTKTKKMSKNKIIRPQLFEIKHDSGSRYVVAYDMIHALQSMPGHSSEKSLEVKQLTGDNISFMNTLHIAKECLPQGLINKTINEKISEA